MPSAPPIVLTAFSGEQPRFIPRLMPDTAAQSARDVRLDDGGLTPMRQPQLIVAAIPLTWKTIYNYFGTWIGWDTVVNAVPGPVADDRLYYTGDGVPKIRVGTTVFDLAIPRPVNALVASVSGGSGDVVSRLYSYTFVSALGEESEPAPLSNSINWMPGASVTLSGFLGGPTGAAAAAPRGPFTQRIYRTQTGSAGTGLYFIDERPVSTGNYVDTKPVTAIAEPCPSISYNAPPTDLEGLISLPNGMMCAYGGGDPEKKKLYFCEPYRPHAWPEKYALTVEHEIMGLGAMNLAILVTTDAHPYLVSGTLPENMTSQKIEQMLPCINKRSVVDLGYAIAYATHEGVVVVRADGSMGIATSNIFNREKWAELNPTTMIASHLSGRYFAFCEYDDEDDIRIRGALMLDVLNPNNFLIRSDAYARAVVYDVSKSALFYAPFDAPEIRQFDPTVTMRKRLYWKSKEFVLPYPENYGAILIDTVDDYSPVDEAAEDDAREERTDANLALITARTTNGVLASLEGDLASTPIGYGEILAKTPPKQPATTQLYNVWPVNGDMLAPMPRRQSSLSLLSELGVSRKPSADERASRAPAAGTLQVGVYANKKQIFGTGIVNRPVRLPSGFRARVWEVDVLTDMRIYRITLAKTMDDLKRTP